MSARRLLRLFRVSPYGGPEHRFVLTLSEGNNRHRDPRFDRAGLTICCRDDRICVEVAGEAEVVDATLRERTKARQKAQGDLARREKRSLVTLYARDGEDRDRLAGRLRLTRGEVDAILDEPWRAPS